MKTGARIITFWLCPAEPARSYFAALISDLATRYEAPVFEPHVTMYVISADRKNATMLLEKVVKSCRPYRLKVRGLDSSDEFTKTLFVQFAPDSGLARLSEELRRASASPSDYQLNPHLSLIYNAMDAETKGRLAASITLPFTDVIFDSLKAVISPAEIKSRQDVEAWRVIAERKLTG